MTRDSPPLTDEQRAPRDARGTSVALAAGAGCGKTTVLTDRFLAYLDGPDRLPLDRIVALTFTEKAALQLREKIRDACRGRLDAGADGEFWKDTLRNLEAARIGTFHGFCGAILRQYPIEAGVEPGSRVLEEAVGPTLRDEALAACVRRWLGTGHPDFLSLAIDRGVPAVREALAGLLEKRAGRDLAPWHELTPADLVATWEAARDGAGLQPAFDLIRREAAGLLELLDRHAPSHPVMQARRAFLLAEIPRLHESRSPRRAVMDLLENARVQGGGTKKNWPSDEVYEAVKRALEEFRKRLEPLAKLLEPDAGRSLKAAEDGLRFARLAGEAVETYTAAKRADGLIDFDDQLLRVRDLLRDGPPHVREALSGSIGVLLVDEFQDTDAIQAEILECLAGEGLIAGRMFLVGDSKQSIYRFRGAQPAIFQAYRERFPEAGRLSLTANFRSVPAILHFANALFADAFPGDEHTLRPGPNSRDLDAPAVELLWAGSTSAALDRRQSEARLLAATLKDRLDRGWMIRDDGATRPATQGDVVLLFRSLNDAPFYEQALAAEGLDYHVVKGSAYFAQQEVIDLINVLAAIEDPHDALALAGTLRGPFFGLSDDGLYWLATKRPGGLVAGFDAWERIEELRDDDRIAMNEANRLLARWRAAKDREPIAALLARILDESGFEPALMGEFLGPRKRANVRKLVAMARAFDLHGGFTLADFVGRLRADLKDPPKEEQASTTDEHGQAIRLMTIHQAKGLEFPIVVVPDLDRNSRRNLPSVVIHPTLGPVAKPCEGDPDDEADREWSLGRKLFEDEEKRAEDEEAIRLFYVAVTRAKDALILASGSDPAADGASPAMKLLASRFDRQTGECLAVLPVSWPRPVVRVIEPIRDRPSGRSSRGGFRPKLLVTARRIERPAARELPGAPEIRSRPRFIDLDALRRLPARAARLDGLLRSALADPALLDPRRLDEVLIRAAKSAAGWPSARVVDEARERLRPWMSGRMWGRIAKAQEVHRGLPYQIAWTLDDPTATVFRGRIDFALREVEGSWSLIQAGVEESPVPIERLNLMLAAYAADALGYGPINSAWLVRLGSEMQAVRIASFDVDAVAGAIANIGLLETRSDRGGLLMPS